MLELEMGLVAVGLNTGEGTQRTLVRFIPGMPFFMPSKKDIIQPHSTTTKDNYRGKKKLSQHLHSI